MGGSIRHFVQKSKDFAADEMHGFSSKIVKFRKGGQKIPDPHKIV